MTDAPAKLNPEKVAIDLCVRISDYLEKGGLWNPEQMEHEKVRSLLIECHAGIDTLTAQLAEARAESEKRRCALVTYAELCEQIQAERDQWKELQHQAHEAYTEMTAECDRLKADLAVVTGELQAMNANHRVMAGELAEMGRERDADAKYRENCGICGEKPHHAKCRLGELEDQLAALSTPKCVNGCEGRFWVEGHRETDYEVGSGVPIGYHDVAGYCATCAAYAKGQEKMREAVVAKVSELGNVEGFIDVPTSVVIEDIRVLPVIDMAGGK